MSPITSLLLLSLVAPFVTVHGAPAPDAKSLKQNGANAQRSNALYASFKKSDPCQASISLLQSLGLSPKLAPNVACVEGSFAQCVNNQWQITACAAGTQCFALPLVNSVGTSTTCDTQADAVARISNTGVSGGLTGSGSPGSSSFATIDSNNSSYSNNSTNSNNSTDFGSGSNSTIYPSSNNANNANPASMNNSMNTDTASSTSIANAGASSSVACSASSPGIFAPKTVTVTVTASSFSPAAQTAQSLAALQARVTRSPTLAPGFTLLPEPSSTSTFNATPHVNHTASTDFSSPTAAALGSASFTRTTLTSASPAIPTIFNNTTFTLSPSSASAFLSSLSAENPDIIISTVSTRPSHAVPSATAVQGAANTAVAFGGSSSYIPSTPPGAAASSSLTSSANSSVFSMSSISQSQISQPPSATATASVGGYGY